MSQNNSCNLIKTMIMKMSMEVCAILNLKILLDLKRKVENLLSSPIINTQKNTNNQIQNMNFELINIIYYQSIVINIYFVV